MGNKIRIKYDAVFRKEGDMVYISHLDLMTLLRRAIRRAGLPFVLTEGFTPRVKISIPMALKLGLESGRELMAFWLTRKMPEEKIKEAINKELPEGIGIVDVQVERMHK